MWAPLQHRGHVAFYERMEIGDWQAMIQLVRDLQSLAVASRLSAFTSLAHFQIATAPSYQECDGHEFISLTWDWPSRLVRVSRGSCDRGWADDLPFETYAPAAAVAAIEPLLHDLLA